MNETPGLARRGDLLWLSGSLPQLTTEDELLVSSGASQSGLQLALESGLSSKLSQREETRPSR